MLRVDRFTGTESRMAVAGGWGEREMGNDCLVSTEFLFYKMENNSGNGWWWWLHSNVNVFSAPELYTYKW